MARALPAAPFLYPIVDSALLAGRDLGEVVRALAEAGAPIVQVRTKGGPDRDRLGIAEEAVRAGHDAGCLVVVNDRPDIALLAGADGVHVGQDDLPPAAVRRLAPALLLGVSTHSLAQLAAAADSPADYLAIGPVFATRSKADPDPVVGVEMVRQARALCGQRPLVAIGGIDASTARAVVEAGASGIAVISAVMSAPSPAAAATELIRRLARVSSRRMTTTRER